MSAGSAVHLVRAGLFPDPPKAEDGGEDNVPTRDELIDLVVRGEYVAVVTSAVGKTLLCPSPGHLESGTTVEDAVSHALKEFLSSGPAESRFQRDADALAVGVAALQLFVQLNWTGPAVDVGPIVEPFRDHDSTPPAPPPTSANDVAGLASESNEYTEQFAAAGLLRSPVPRALEELTIDGEVAYRHTQAPEFLCLARAVLCGAHGIASVIWASRAAFAHQCILSNPAASLYDAIVPPLVEYIPTVAADESTSGEVLGRLHLELGNYHAFYREVYRAQDCWVAAKTAFGLELEMTGALGVRTKFQEEQIAQLRLDVKHGHTTVRETQPVDLPAAVDLNDDTRLEGIQFEGGSTNTALSIAEQAVVLALCTNVKNQNAKHGLTTEEMLPYVSCVKSFPRDWAIQLVALWTTSRIELEASDMRARPRAIEQMLQITQLPSKPAPPPAWRLQNFWAVRMQPRWKVERELADANLALGCTRDAVEVFERWEIWDGMIECYTRLDFQGKAEALVRERLKVETGVAAGTLWCVLGDLHDEADHYRKAWEVSGGKSARSQSSLGSLLVRRAETKIGLGPTAESRREIDGVGQAVETLESTYREAMAAFQNAVKLNRMLSAVWFKLGCTALRVDDWATAATAFRQRVDLDPEDYEAWNNLANAYIKLGKKRKAFYALRESVKNEYNNWKIWENFVLVAVDVGAFADVVRGINRLIDLKQSYNDGEILQILVNVTTQEGFMDLDGRKATLLIKQVTELVGRIKSSSTLSSESWSAVATFHQRTGDADLALQCRRSAFQAAKSVKEWERSKKGVERVVEALDALSDAAKNADEKKKALSTAKLLTSSALKVLSMAREKGYAAASADDAVERLKSLVLDLDEVLASFQS